MKIFFRCLLVCMAVLLILGIYLIGVGLQREAQTPVPLRLEWRNGMPLQRVLHQEALHV